MTPTQASDSPSARQTHAIAYDASRDRLVLFGGDRDDTRRSSDTWEWDGSVWKDVTTPEGSAAPPARRMHAMAYHGGLEMVVLFGGGGEDELLDDTWAWDGSSWIELDIDNRPEARHRHAMAYDSARGRIVLFGGNQGAFGEQFGDTWELVLE